MGPESSFLLGSTAPSCPRLCPGAEVVGGTGRPPPLQATSTGDRDQVESCMVSIFLLGDPGLRRLLRVTRHGACREAGALERG